MDHRKIRKSIWDKGDIVHRKILMVQWERGNTKASQSPLHSEIETLIWTIEYMRNLHNLLLYCNGLFSFGENSFRNKRMISFCKLFGRYTRS